MNITFTLFFKPKVFYWSHLLYVPYWVLLIVHAPAFWKWFIVPCIVFIIEKVYRTGNR